MPKCQQPPSHSKQQPAAQKSHGKDDQGETPFEIHQCGEHVLEESALFANVLVRKVACTAFGDEARFVYAVPKHGFAGHPRCQSRYSELIRDDTFTWQHYLESSEVRSSPEGQKGMALQMRTASVKRATEVVQPSCIRICNSLGAFIY